MDETTVFRPEGYDPGDIPIEEFTLDELEDDVPPEEFRPEPPSAWDGPRAEGAFRPEPPHEDAADFAAEAEEAVPEPGAWEEDDIPIGQLTMDELEEAALPDSQSPREEETAPAPVWYEPLPEEEEDEEEPEDLRPDAPPRRPRLLNRKGRLAHTGWDTEAIYEYNKERIRRPSRRKEWEFYQLSNSRFTFQVVYGHTGYAGLVSATLVDFATGERFTSGKPRLFPGDSLDLDFSAGEPHALKYEDDDLFLSVSFDGQTRRIVVRSERFDADISCHDEGDAVVTVVPFGLRSQFFYGCKKVFRDLAGHLQMHNGVQVLDGETFLLLNSGRGVLPYRTLWLWASGAAETGQGVLALNFGAGPGREDSPTENAVFLDGRIHKLGRVNFQFDPGDPLHPWHISDSARRVRLTFRPDFDNYTHANRLLFRFQSHQVFGRLSGTVELDDGERLRLDDVPFFCQHIVNHG